MDYFDFDGKKFLLLIDYFSKFMYVEEMRTSTAKATINKLKKIFSIEGSQKSLYPTMQFSTVQNSKHSAKNGTLSISLVHPITPNQMDKQNELYKP